MEIVILNNKEELGEKTAITGAELIRKAIEINCIANIIVATGASQLKMLKEFVKENIDWSKV
ncbi:MAG: glucosamine-6-phosphate deaminase, partial [Cyclobacteriaceae bacterium]|nr:glucosamine-6-phosphate deaminase [Cyclobacteriaceae bacterium]